MITIPSIYIPGKVIVSIFIYILFVIVHRIIILLLEQKTRVHISSQCTHRKKNETYRIEKKMNQSIYF